MPQDAPLHGARFAAEAPVDAPLGKARRAADLSGEHDFGQAIGWTALGTLIPGLGLWRSGRRLAGGIIMGIALTLGVGAVSLAFLNRATVLDYLVNPQVLTGIAVGLLVLALAWVALVGVTHLKLRPARPSFGQRAAGAAVVGVLSFIVAAPLALGANLAWTTAGTVEQMFGNDLANAKPIDATDPWKDRPRYNVLVLGADSGYNRSDKLGARPDTVIVASIDTKTGATTLITLPRNTAKMPFPADSPLHDYYPNGFYDGVNPANAEYFLNAMYRNVPARVKDHEILGPNKNFAAEVMKVSVGEALGLDIDNYVMINMDGFKDFINAIGGITVNVNYPIPIGGQTDAHILPDGYIDPGPNQHLNGRLALWYARGRYGLDDYKRMERQRCVINAVVQQAQPATVLQNYQAIAAAGEKTIETDVPRSLLPALLGLAGKVQGTKLRSVVFTPGTAGFYSSNPDWEKVQARVKKALKETSSGVESTDEASATPSGTASASQSPSASSTPSTSASSTPSASPTKKAKSDDLDLICGYHPED